MTTLRLGLQMGRMGMRFEVIPAPSPVPKCEGPGAPSGFGELAEEKQHQEQPQVLRLRLAQKARQSTLRMTTLG